LGSLYKYYTKKGTLLWRVVFRNRGLKTIDCSFDTEEEAKMFLDEFTLFRKEEIKNKKLKKLRGK